MPKLSKADRAVLERMTAGWCPLAAQVVNWLSLERRGLVRINWGPEGSPDADKYCLYLTDKGRKAIENA